MVGALEKEIRLSFAQRIRGTLPEPYQPMLSLAKEKETPDFKYAEDSKLYDPPLGPDMHSNIFQVSLMHLKLVRY